MIVISKRHIFIGAGSSIETDNQHLYIETNRQGQTEEHTLSEIGGIFAYGQFYAHRNTFSALLSASVPVAFFDAQGCFIGRLEPMQQSETNLSQHQIQLPRERQLELGCTWVHAAIEQRYRFMQRKQRDRGLDLAENLQGMEPVLKRFDARWPEQHPVSSSELLGVYGAGMAIYWEAFQKFYPHFEFDGGRKGNSVLNQLVNFSHELLEQFCLNLLLANGFDVSFGIIHSDTDRRHIPPLARDFAIEHRIYAEQVVTRLIGRNMLTLKDFPDMELSARVCKLLADEFLRKMHNEITHPATGVKCEYQQAFQLQIKQLKEFYLDPSVGYTALLLK